MNTSTMAACVSERSPTLRLRQIWSDTVVVSADRRLVISPAHARETPLLYGHF
jgi:TnpA family transposase